MTIMNYQETLEYLYNRLPVFHLIGSEAYKPGLDNTVRLMEFLGNPHTKFRSIHVAGTNGKGSVSNFLAAILQESGYKVGLYTSPHLVDFGERIRINGLMIDENYVIDFISRYSDVIETVKPSFFELTMAMAFSYFADNKVDIAVIEVGLGGRLDSTNIINPELSIITNIGFDHIEFLGNTLPQIAYEKAGIIKKHVPVVVGEYLDETKPVFLKKAAEMEADIYFVEDSTTLPKFIRYEANKMVFKHDNHEYSSDLIGQYQLKNIATVLFSCDVINSSKSSIKVSSNAIFKGIENVCEITGLRGRWETLQNNPLIIADTGHNVPGIKVVVEQLKFHHYKSLRIIFGMVNDKDISGVLQLLPDNAIYYFTQAQVKRALNADELKQKAEVFNLRGKVYHTINDAVNIAIDESDTDDLILITGSNFVVGEALGMFSELAR